MSGLGNIFGGGAGGEAKAKAEKYGKLAEALRINVQEITSQKDIVEENLVSLYTIFTSQEDSAEGQIIITYDTHVANWQSDYTFLLNNIQTGISSLNSLIRSAEELEKYWNQIAEIEEMRTYAGI